MNNEDKILGLLAEMKADMVEMKADMVEMKADMVEMKADMVEMKAKLEEVDQRSIRTQVLLETEIQDKIQLLFDGHELIKEKLDELAPKSRVDDLEDDVAMLKDVVKLMRLEIAELKKAQ